MRIIKLAKNPYVLFFPFLILFINYVLVHPTDGTFGDESQYLRYAEHLLTLNFKEPLFANGTIPTGPGYPIILMPFVLFKLPLVSITLLNALFLYLSIVLLYKTLQLVVEQRMAIIVSLFWGFYHHHNVYMNRIFSEVFTLFLIALLIFIVVKTFNSIGKEKINKYLIISGITLSFLVLTKVIFAYVVLVLLLGSVVLWFRNKKSVNFSRVLMILLISIGLNIPYLTYTYYHTGKIFYWATYGGNNLYWLSTPYEGEYGDWQFFEELKYESTTGHSGMYFFNDFGDWQFYDGLKQDSTVGNIGISLKNDSNISNHLKVYDEIINYNGIQQDDKLKSIAIKNIKMHPKKFLKNWINNVGRILFDFPYAYKLQNPRKLRYIPLNAIICVLLLFSLIPAYRNWNRINFAIRFLILFSLVYLGGSTFGSSEVRMFTIIAPVLLLWIAYILQNAIIINFKFNAVLSNTHENENLAKKE